MDDIGFQLTKEPPTVTENYPGKAEVIPGNTKTNSLDYIYGRTPQI